MRYNVGFIASIVLTLFPLISSSDIALINSKIKRARKKYTAFCKTCQL